VERVGGRERKTDIDHRLKGKKGKRQEKKRGKKKEQKKKRTEFEGRSGREKTLCKG